MSFTMRTTKPERSNKYYITKSAGGWSDAIIGIAHPNQFVGITSSVNPTQTTSSYLVKVITDALNICQGQDTGNSITGCIRDKCIYTIVETSGNWGKLKSGIG